ncbi:MAG: metallophosphoesterase [Burkholderiales bacterium]
MRILAPLVGVALVLAAPARARDEACELAGVARVVAIGDVHGAYPEFLAVLRLAGLVEAKERWSGGKTHLVQTGDILDRGSETRQVMDLLMRLEGEARKAGGRVHALLGNHEAMNLLGDLRYVSREEYKAFETGRSRETRQAFYESRRDAARVAAKGAKQPFDEAAFRAKFDEDVPLGLVERVQAFSEEGRYGRWLRERRPLVKIDDSVFLHGGLTPEAAALGCETINATVRREITSDLVKTRQQPQASLAAGDNGPLWFRGMAREDETTWLPSLERVLAGIGARRVVIGHTVTGDGRIKTRFDGRVVMIDVGMNPVYGRNLAALEIGQGDALAALYESGREELLRPAAAALGSAR